MGSYSTLTIGAVSLAWKYEVPTYLTFLFREEDLYIQREESLPTEQGETPHTPEDYEIRRAGFRTTVRAAKEALDGHGYTLDFFAGIYDSFLPSIEEEVRDILDEEFASRLGEGASTEEIERQVTAHLTAQPTTSLDDLDAFVAFLRRALATDFQMPPFLADLEESPWLWPPSNRPRAEILGDFEHLQTLIFGRAPDIPATVLRPLQLLSEEWLFRFAEVLSLLYARLVLDASEPDATVDLEVSEIVEDEPSLRALHIDLAFMLLHKVDVYERVFKALSERESDVRDRYNRQRARAQLEALDSAATPQERGGALEQLMAVIFSLPPELEVTERNYRSANEEVDIVLKNNVARPFWQALNSPLIFVECKHWRHKVPPDVVNRLERKLKNHAPQARVGILVAPKGITAGAKTAIRDSARESILIVAVERADLDSLVKEGRSILDWLEALLSRPV